MFYRNNIWTNKRARRISHYGKIIYLFLYTPTRYLLCNYTTFDFNDIQYFWSESCPRLRSTSIISTEFGLFACRSFLLSCVYLTCNCVCRVFSWAPRRPPGTGCTGCPPSTSRPSKTPSWENGNYSRRCVAAPVRVYSVKSNLSIHRWLTCARNLCCVYGWLLSLHRRPLTDAGNCWMMECVKSKHVLSLSGCLLIKNVANFVLYQIKWHMYFNYT